MVAMAEAYLADVSAETSGESADRFQLVLHSSVEELAAADEADDDGTGSHLEGGLGRSWRVGPVTARRLACDCPAAAAIDGPDGTALHLGRRTRRIRGRLRRAVQHRDEGLCRAPACTDAATQIHHVRHWAHGGPTCLSNLISLCDRHHWLVHEGGYRLVAAEPGHWVLISPEGARLGPHPEPHSAAQGVSVGPDVTADAVTGHWDGSQLDPTPIIWAVLPDSDNVSVETSEPDSGGCEAAPDYGTVRLNAFTT